MSDYAETDGDSRANDKVVIRPVRIRKGFRTVTEWGWTRISANGKKISTSGESYQDRGYTIDMACNVNRGIPVVREDGTPVAHLPND